MYFQHKNTNICYIISSYENSNFSLKFIANVGDILFIETSEKVKFTFKSKRQILEFKTLN